MYFSYLLYQAERDKSPREQLEADVRAGERAKSFARLWHSLLPRGARWSRLARTNPSGSRA